MVGGTRRKDKTNEPHTNHQEKWLPPPLPPSNKEKNMFNESHCRSTWANQWHECSGKPFSLFNICVVHIHSLAHQKYTVRAILQTHCRNPRQTLLLLLLLFYISATTPTPKGNLTVQAFLLKCLRFHLPFFFPTTRTRATRGSQALGPCTYAIAVQDFCPGAL